MNCQTHNFDETPLNTFSMQRKFGMKRSFHCEDLSSIVDSLTPAPIDHTHDDDTIYADNRNKRIRVVSYDSSLASVCSFHDRINGRNATLPLTTMSSWSSDDYVAEESPFSFTKPVTPEFGPTIHQFGTSEDSSLDVPSLPLLSSNVDKSLFPATAALDKIVSNERMSVTDSALWEGEISPFCGDQCNDSDGDDHSSFCNPWPIASHEENPLSPSQVNHFPSQSFSTKMSDFPMNFSAGTKSHHGDSNNADEAANAKVTPSFHLFSLASPRRARSRRTALKQRPIPSVNQITKALAMM
mmetsp:Transcript_15323/g.32402  ORF Transcript_15323/g.32402 Transcript_15323/m.32402 type:complete len:298 (+) Transcript_15323:231-1124(+)